MMEQISIYLVLFSIIVFIGQVFGKSVLPISLILAITGIILSFIPNFPHVTLNPEVVLNIFLPILIYQVSAFSSWRDIKKNLRPIALLSIGHVIFITFLVAVVVHTLIPQIDWPLAFVLGAVISPPDDVAIVSIAEKISMPRRVITILEGEAMFNDAAALILFRFALAALITHEIYVLYAFTYFFAVIIGETLYGFLIGYIMGELRLKISNSKLHIIASLLTPFFAYFPVEMLGGSGILATAIAGFIIGHRYAIQFTPDFRLLSRDVWPALAFVIQSLLFLLVGLNMGYIIENISAIPHYDLLLYSIIVVLTVIIGRFIWVYAAMIYLPRFLFTSIRKKDPTPPWQYPFILSWAGMRGSISLAAALAVPVLTTTIDGANARDLIIFFVICVIAVTLILQGASLPWLLKVIGVQKHGQREEYDEHLAEIKTRLLITKSVLRWLTEYKKKIKNNEKLLEQVKLYIRQYRLLKLQLKEALANHETLILHDQEAELQNEIFLLSQIVEVERARLLQLWQNEKISLTIRNKLIERLDHRVKNITG